MNNPSKFGSSTGAASKSSSAMLSNALMHSTRATSSRGMCARGSGGACTAASQPNDDKCTTIKSNNLGREQAQLVHSDQLASTSSSQHQREEVAFVVNLHVTAGSTCATTSPRSSTSSASSSSNSNYNNLQEEEWSAPLKKEGAQSTSAFSKRNANSRDKHHYAIGAEILAELSESDDDDDDFESMDDFCEDNNEITTSSFYGLEQ